MVKRVTLFLCSLFVFLLAAPSAASAADADDARHYDFDSSSGVRTLTVTLNGCNGGGLQLNNGHSWNNRIDAWLSIECNASHYNTFNYTSYLGGGKVFTRTNLGSQGENRTSSIKYA